MYPDRLFKLTWGGTVRSEDIWSNGVHMQVIGTAEQQREAFDEFNLTAAFNAVQSAMSGPAGRMQYNTLAWAKLALIGRDGKYVTDARLYEPPNPIAGTNSASGRAVQDTFVVSLLTDTKRGLANRGRIYPPSGFAVLDQNGLLTETLANTYLGKFKTMIDAINALGQESLAKATVVVASKQGAGAMRVVERVAVGNLLDAQNRRRNKLSEIYYEQPII